MAQVIRIGANQTPTEYQDEMVELLETVIAEIRSGRAVSFAIATVTQDDESTARWMARGHVLSTIGAAHRLTVALVS